MWHGPWATERLDQGVNASCVDVYIQELVAPENSEFLFVNMSEELGHSHAMCRGWVTWEYKNSTTTLEELELNAKLSAAMDAFDKHLINLDDVQSQYELSLQDEDAILNDITTAADFRDSTRRVRTLANEKCKEFLWILITSLQHMLHHFL